jgi:DNA-binding NarL/FixJ family response regulator
MYPEEQFAIRVIKAGASGYLSKNSALSELTGAMQNLLDGKKYISESVADILVSDLRQDLKTYLHSSLSEREFQVLCSLGSGKTVSQIATELSLSVKTISTHRSNILSKMGMKTTAELIRYALNHNLIS